jgi:hypothetical protein
MKRVWRSAGRTAVLTTVVLGTSATAVFAQGLQAVPWTDQAFVSINGGQQTTAHEVEVQGSFPLYGETASFESRVGVGQSSMFDIMGGYRLWQNLAVSVAFSRYSETSSATVEARIPDPLFFDRLRSDVTTVGGLEHSEKAVHISLFYLVPIHDRIDVAVFTGPTIISVKKDLASGVTVPSGGTTIDSTTTTRISESGTGAHFGVDLRFRIVSDRGALNYMGVGLFARYAAASVSAPVRGGDIDVGGLQIGAGLRIGF